MGAQLVPIRMSTICLKNTHSCHDIAEKSLTLRLATFTHLQSLKTEADETVEILIHLNQE